MKPMIFKASFLLILFQAGAGNGHSRHDPGSYYKSFDGTKIYYEVKGTGRPVLLVHGFIVDGESWKRTHLHDDLLKAGYKVITLDLRGNGKSDKPHKAEAYENDAEAKDIIGLLDHLKIKKYMVVGYSRGSIIVSRLLVMDPRVEKAVMGGMGADFTNPEWPRRLMFYHALRGDSVPELATMVKNVKNNPALDQTALMYMQKFQPSTSKAKLNSIKIPVLTISGTEDSENGSSAELTSLIPNAKHADVPGDHGHAVGTKEFSDSVLRFFK